MPSAWSVATKVIGELYRNTSTQTVQKLRQNPILRISGYSLAFFDGASIDGGSICGAGGIIKHSNNQVFRWYFNGGSGTNTKAELLGAWASLTITKLLDIQYIQVLGDSKVIIEWLNHQGKLRANNIEGWKQRLMDLVITFKGTSFHHIFRESNGEADLLSKQALSEAKGRISYFTWDGSMAGPTHHIDIF
jgi:ribonuclease HI